MTVKEYFNGDELAADVWESKYKIEGEKTPHDMHIRMAEELARPERKYVDIASDREGFDLSDFGKALEKKLRKKSDKELVDWIMEYLGEFRYIVPQGSIMTMLGNKRKIGSLSNCFVVPSPHDSYGGILRTDQQLAQLMKRRGGVGTNINTLRPSDTPVSNAAGTSTGAASFMHRFSNTTREVAQNGRRGALMLLISCKHPDVYKFVNMKKDRTQVTGANISVMLTDDFMQAVEKDQDFYCSFPIEHSDDIMKAFPVGELPYNKLSKLQTPRGDGWVVRIRARELFDQIVENAWENAEPGVAFMDRVHEYSPEGVYPQFRAIASNPCGEQWMQAYDACRLLAANLLNLVRNAFTQNAKLDLDRAYEVFYIQQRLADDIVDLEIEYVDRIIDKINNDNEPDGVKNEELMLWKNVRKTAKESRRTGCGFTGLGDMLAAIGLKYDSDEALKVIEQIMKVKMRAELDCTIDMALLRGKFEGHNSDLEFYVVNEPRNRFADGHLMGKNAFYQMIITEFGESMAMRMMQYGRRNVSWSTVAPTGTVSLMTQTTSGLEPLFLAYYMRRKKVNPSDKGIRVDFVDQNGDSWTEYPVLHPQFKEWLLVQATSMPDAMAKQDLGKWFEESPWYGATANDIDWRRRVEIQGIIQKYTTNAISSTLNLPNNVSKETVSGIYMTAWKTGLKGVTIYRDGCRSGVLVADSAKKSSFDYSDAVKRPKEIEGHLHVVTVKGVKYGVIIGMMDEKPYELFAFNLPDEIKESCNGKIVKVKKGHYNFVCEDGTLKNLQEAAVKSDELVLTRLVSGMLRHGAKPQFVMEQIDKCDLEVVSFGKAISRVLKKYVKDEDMVARNKCKDCGSANVRMQEGCLTCLDCGSSKCG